MITFSWIRSTGVWVTQIAQSVEQAPHCTGAVSLLQWPWVWFHIVALAACHPMTCKHMHATTHLSSCSLLAFAHLIFYELQCASSRKMVLIQNYHADNCCLTDIWFLGQMHILVLGSRKIQIPEILIAIQYTLYEVIQYLWQKYVMDAEYLTF